MTRRAMRALPALGVFLATLGLLASPASAHSTSGPPASNFHAVVRGVTPTVRGVHARLGADGEQIELRVDGGARVTVLGYQGEPYLRVSRAGVFENRESPAVALNRTRVPTGAAPRGPIGPARWVRISSGSTARWHDHRAHWMGGATPAAVRRDPDRSHVIGRWRIPIRVDGAPGTVTGSVARASAVAGSIDWSPPPNALLWIGLAVLLAAVVLVGTHRRARPTLLVALAVLAIAESVHLWGSWPF